MLLGLVIELVQETDELKEKIRRQQTMDANRKNEFTRRLDCMFKGSR